jgi:putative nucleotidyltransferase with HDIG domain
VTQYDVVDEFVLPALLELTKSVGRGVQLIIMKRTTPLILAVIAGAISVSLLLPSVSASSASDEFMAIAVLSGLALVAELLSFLMPKGVLGSISSMPGLAIILISPSWQAVLAIGGIKVVVESVRRADFEKAVFNIGQYVLTFGLAALVYLKMGGESLLHVRADGVSTITVVAGVPAFVAFALALGANTLLVSAVVAMSTGAKLESVLRSNTFLKIGVDILASPLIFVFAWAYVRYGPIASAALWVPIIGLRQVYKTNLELEQTNVELLDLMVKSIEARDPYTSGHSRRVQDYSILICRALGLSEKDVQMIGRAALLHDVGKIHEKYGPILRKAERLSPEEWNTMRAHPIDGADLIATMTRLRELVAPVRHHHENWDGTGYPDGMAGELIPLAARIIRFADTIDAMTTKRPYRAVMSSEQVRAEIVRCRGSQFDPQMVDRLLSSPIWKTMFAPVEAGPTRFGALAVVSGLTGERSGSASRRA